MTWLFRPFRLFALLLISTGGWAALSDAHDYALGSVSIAHPWALPTAPGARTGAAFMKISNRGKTDVRLTGGFSHFAGGVEIHSMSIDDGIMRMRHLQDGLVIPAGGEAEFRPGGLHLMLTGLQRPLVLHDRVPLTLLFEGGAKINMVLFVDQPVGTPTHQGH
ncbi:MAG: copper chaperone PCu(A)C [Alphaproteobacteria bacterium]|nr:copper chaperone PCu(A)C [Alphaproteobacteria bacterium]